MSKRLMAASRGGRRWHSRRSTWFTASCVVHGLAAAAVLWLTPVGTRIREAAVRPRPVSGARLDRMAEQLRARAEAHMRAYITILEHIATDLDALRFQLAEELAPGDRMEDRPAAGPPATAHDAPPARHAHADLVAQYASARGLDTVVVDTFERIRVKDLALRQGMPLAEADGMIDIPRPARPEADAAVLTDMDVRTHRRFERFRAEVAMVLDQTAEMVAAARRMREAARLMHRVAVTGLDAPDPIPTEDLPHFVTDLVSDYHGGRVVDMTAWMQDREAREDDGDGRAAREAYPHDIMGPARFERPPPAQLTAETPMTAARRVVADGWRGEWLFVNSWHTVGPFPNDAREHVQSAFPPDRAVDLEAEYTGKDGLPIRWQFVQSHGPKIHPANPDEYGIWYAYTELYFDRSRDLWVALGSDDFGWLQVNGMTVWESSLGLKGWRIDEAWRRIHFRQGLNRLLFRLENGWRGLGFSVTLWLADEA